MIKFEATVTHVGELVNEFVDEGILVFFGETAPHELREFSIIHDGEFLETDLVPEDVVSLDGVNYRILAVGDIANTNFRNLGHLVLKFNGEFDVELPGDVCVEKKELSMVQPGSKILIYTKKDI